MNKTIDWGTPDGDHTVITYWRKPNIFERILRKLGISKARWTMKIVKQETVE